MTPSDERIDTVASVRNIPWGTVVAAVAALVFAAPTLVLPADSPVGPKLVFIAVGAILLAVAIVLTRREPGSTPATGADDREDVRP